MVIPVMTQHYAMMQRNLLTASRSRGVRFTDECERQVRVVTAENVAGVLSLHDHLVWVEPISGTAFPAAEDEAILGTAAQQNAVH